MSETLVPVENAEIATSANPELLVAPSEVTVLTVGSAALATEVAVEQSVPVALPKPMVVSAGPRRRRSEGRVAIRLPGEASDDPVRDYFNKIAKTPLLNAEQEVELAKRIEAGLFAEKLLEVLRTSRETGTSRTVAFEELATEQLLGRLTSRQKEKYRTSPFLRAQFAADTVEERIRLGQSLSEFVDGLLPEETTDEVQTSDPEVLLMQELEMLVADGARAKVTFLESNLRLVVSIAKRYGRRDGDFMKLLDLAQEGNVGLIRAVEKFDFHRGYKFSTYATWWIRQAITRSLSEQERIIRIPAHSVEALNRITRAKRELETELDHEPTHEEIAAKLRTGISDINITAERVADLLASSRKPLSLDLDVGYSGPAETGTEFGALITEDDAEPSPVEFAEYTLMREKLEELIAGLDGRTAQIVRMRHGLAGYDEMTLDAIAKEFGVTRERIRQIDARAMEKLRKSAGELGLKEFLVD